MPEEDAIEPASRIQFDDGIHPVQSARRSAVGRQSNATDLDDEEKAQRIANTDLNVKHKQNYSGFLLLWVAFQSTGIIYGDIGTSPLYVYSSTFTSQPSWDDLVGALSIIIWSLTLIVTIKYTFIVLRADDDGQGGTFALYSLLARYTHIVKGDPKNDDTVKLERYLTGELKPGGKSLRKFLENSPAAQFALKAIGVLGVSLVMADGILTPAQSVLGAIQGIKVADPTLTTPTIVGISCAILVLLFLIQPFGTSKLGTGFAPIVTVWLLFNLASGIYNLAVHDHTVLKAFSPHYAFTYLIRNGYDGWKSLGGLLLAFTGVEALFADLGAFSKRAIQISWLCLAYPCLIFAYAGQAAFIANDKSETAFTNPFFYTVPPGSFYPSLVIAVLAAIVASQAMITSTFQLLSQVMRLSYFPHIKVVHTSNKFHEQVYMPMANWLLMIGTVAVTGIYNTTTSLGHAYGVCVILVTFISTCMVSLVAILVWRIPSFVVIPIFLIFAALDGAFMSAVLTKVPDGAWFTLLLAFILSSIFILWRFGKEAQWSAESLDRLLPSDVLSDSDSQNSSSVTRLTESFGSTPVSTVPGLGVFFDKSGDSSVLPVSFAHFVLKFAARPAVLIFFHMRPLPVPFVDSADRFVVTRTSGIANCYNVVLRHGYADDVVRPGMARDLVAQVELVVSRAAAPDAAELQALREAYSSQIVYVLGKETMKIKRDGRFKPWAITRWIILEIFLWIRENSRTKMANVNIDVDRLVEVGFLKEI
ncbi:potassium transporter-domain-containing protein [Ilyonectria robusta]|uniref:potassium transporter-domain-containing protein n=1 Tax=Ilyonectria robusta TaxID=1079257 RepID=UPI001E8D97F6|nr:potassium transporter-domain-containing protein [Ilyonectria robusta]KAH8672443.1 potassium transporter-domain-containing protein [Ilyonectria robusta]